MLVRSEFTGDYGGHLDVVITEISPPDDKGFCSFGAAVWNKKAHLKRAKLSIAEVNKNLIRTYGDNYVHVSEIDYFVEHLSGGGAPGTGSLAGRAVKKPEPYLERICEIVSGFVKDGDTVQIGVGRTTEPLVGLGLFNGRSDIGWHSEATPPGVVSLIRQGVINGSRKTHLPGKAVVTSIGGSTTEEISWVNLNPVIWLVDVNSLYRTVPLNDNMLAINNALTVDLTGQISAESIGRRVMSAPGGQPAFTWGALSAKGGRAIVVLPATARVSGHLVSRIVATFEAGTAVTIPRWGACIVVTEYGAADLRGKSLRRRAEALIEIAHPDFRAELTKEARKLLWP
jgi:4-hydroxybutyrate CoA-transferase